MATFTLDECSTMLPLVRAIGSEIVDRRGAKRQLSRLRETLELSTTPEGLKGALAELDARILEHDTALRRSVDELESLGLTVLRSDPLTVHFPGRTRSGKVVFCWQEGEESVCHGHEVGAEEEPRRPLRVRVIDAGEAD